MPAVLVHGVPDTTEMWEPMRAQLTREDIVALQLPGFGTPRPDGFGASKEEYADWITEQIRAIGEPVDLVGHDWGSLLVQRVASTHPELIRTFACGSGPVDRTYEWHAMAQLWQTPAPERRSSPACSRSPSTSGSTAWWQPGRGATSRPNRWRISTS